VVLVVLLFAVGGLLFLLLFICCYSCHWRCEVDEVVITQNV